jgi:hypothetical protein
MSEIKRELVFSTVTSYTLLVMEGEGYDVIRNYLKVRKGTILYDIFSMRNSCVTTHDNYSQSHNPVEVTVWKINFVILKSQPFHTL